MELIETGIPGVVIVQPRIFGDERGYFFELFSQRDFERQVCRTVFVQDNESKSCYGVVRGLHFQKPPYAQSKLVRVVKGRVLDVAVDIRKGSPTFGKYVSVELEKENKYEVSGKNLKDFLDMIDVGQINEAENILLDGIDYSNRDEVIAAALFYQHLSEKDSEFLESNNYTKEEVFSGFEQLLKQSGYADLLYLVKGHE